MLQLGLREHRLHLAAAAVTAYAAGKLALAAAKRAADAGAVGLCCTGSLASGMAWEVGSMALGVLDGVAGQPDAAFNNVARAVWQQAKWLLPLGGGVALVAATAPVGAPSLACVALELLACCLDHRRPTRHLPWQLQALLAVPALAAAVADNLLLEGRRVAWLEWLRRLQFVRQYPPQPREESDEPEDLLAQVMGREYPPTWS